MEALAEKLAPRIALQDCELYRGRSPKPRPTLDNESSA
jgi:hypothetical protein